MTDIAPQKLGRGESDWGATARTSERTIDRSTHLRAARLGAVLAGPALYVAIAFGLMANTWAAPTTTIIGSGGDPQAYLWALQWPAFAIGHGIDPFYSHYLIAPQGTNLAWSGSSGPGIVLAPLVMLIGPVLLYNLLATLSLALSAWLAQVAIYRLVPSRLGSIAGGLLFGFSPFMLGHSWGHVTITLAVLPPIALIVLHETFIRQRWRWWTVGLLAGLVVTFQLITFVETLAITLLALVVAMILLVIQRPKMIREKVSYAWRALAATVASSIVFAAYPLWTLLFGAQKLGHGTVEPPDSFVTDALNFVVPSLTTRFVPGFIASTSSRVTIGVVESGGYLGIVFVTILLYTTVRYWRLLLVRTAALTGLVLAVLSLGPRLHVDGTVLNFPLPFALFLHLPVLGNILAARLMGVADLCFAVLLAVFVEQLARVGLPQRLAGDFAVLAGFFLIFPALPTPQAPYAVPAYFTGRAVDRIPAGTTALVAPYETNGSDDDPQMWQAASGFRFKMPEGYLYVPTPAGPITGPIPTALGTEMDQIGLQTASAPRPTLTEADRISYFATLKSWNIKTVIVGPMPNDGVMVQFFQQLLGRPGTAIGGVTVWYGVRP
ncbi:MAG: hypothetical protein JWM85_1465 [Acidimicrobiaceae bacterium]|nr:hypothetical protein [Acidimicrobiaceae bacterium]